jgi:hypothetical protein
MKYTIEFTPDEINLVGAALGKMPYESVAALVARLQADVAKHEAVKPVAIPEEAHDVPVEAA